MTDEQYLEEMEIIEKFRIEVVMNSSIRPTDMDEGNRSYAISRFREYILNCIDNYKTTVVASRRGHEAILRTN